ncbi:hypothetical protein HPB51_014172 [Rhipicephalus microplus]|uniref:Uncharacterized protein n=1 Tax=Rhipicephalus microplus TaxID=6941 RepID=A0A9J6E245_RHIMP|nr:hypothetical protein HPB51_014172 [Rhipicephalus microplus]
MRLLNFAYVEIRPPRPGFDTVTIGDFKIDTVIAISSVGAIDTQAGCYSVPPTVFSSPMARFPSLSTLWELISLKMAYIKNATAGLSFEMGTMMYWLKAQASNFTGSFYQRCEYLTMTSRDAVCGTQPAQYQEGDYYIYGGFVANNSQQGVAFADYDMSGQKKWEKARRDGEAKGLKLRRRVAIMLFNVHLEDIDKKCSVAPFAVETHICEALKGAGKCQ